MDFLREYNNIINDVYNNVLRDALISSFVHCYGDKYKTKIKNIVDNLVILRTNKSMEREALEKKSKLYILKIRKIMTELFLNDEFNLISDDDLILRCEQVLNDDNYLENNLIKFNDLEIVKDKLESLKRNFYKFKYNDSLKDIYSKNKNIIVGRNIESEEYDNLALNYEYSDELACGAACMNLEDTYLIILDGFGINLFTLIHEINHLLSKELLVFSSATDSYYSYYGFLKRGDLFYEVINEYVSLEVFNDVNKRFDKDFDFVLSRDIESGYLDIDRISNNLVKEIYNLYGESIKEFLINGNGYIFLNILGKLNYYEIVEVLNKVYEVIMELKKDNLNLRAEDVVLDSKFVIEFEHCLNVVKECFQQYFQYNEDVQNKLNDLVVKGSARRL